MRFSTIDFPAAPRLAEAKATVPHFQVQTDVVMAAPSPSARSSRRAVQEIVPSFNDPVVKAAALGLREHPLANGVPGTVTSSGTPG
jgi:pyruvate dehydrogenase E2 component (dihydrolipoamide acetyltransferase)